MSKLSELAYDIEQLYIEGMSARQIANELDLHSFPTRRSFDLDRKSVV